MNFSEYKHLVRIRVLMDENPKKAKQILTDQINKYENTHFTDKEQH